MKTAIVTDSSACVSKGDAEALGIYVVRMPLTINDEDTLEEEGISREAFIEAMLQGATVSTSQPNLFKTATLFNELLETYDQILYLPISRKLSGTYESACMLAQEYEGKVCVVDTLAVSYPLLNMALQAKQFAEDGMALVDIKQRIEDQWDTFASLIPESIEYLKRGGRINATVAAVANLLKIIPILSVTDGEIDLLDKVRTHKKAIKAGIDHAFEGRNIEDYDWVVIDGAAREEVVSTVMEAVEARIGRPPLKRKLYPIVMAHTGPGTIVIACAKRL